MHKTATTTARYHYALRAKQLKCFICDKTFGTLKRLMLHLEGSYPMFRFEYGRSRENVIDVALRQDEEEEEEETKEEAASLALGAAAAAAMQKKRMGIDEANGDFYLGR